MKRITALMMCLLMMTSVVLASCSDSASQGDGKNNASQSGEVNSSEVDTAVSDYTGMPVDEHLYVSDSDKASALDFCVRLFQKSVEASTDENEAVNAAATAGGGDLDTAEQEEGASLSAGYAWPKNSMVSPLSVMYALSMTANGAREETLAQMEDVLGMKVDELNAYLKAYMQVLPKGEKYKLSIANSIWLTNNDRFSVEDDFLKANEEFYDAGIFKVPFNDATCKEINAWVEEHTDGMVKDILDKIPEDAVMYLVNAMAFDAEWQTIYKENQIRQGVFYAEDGSEQEVTMMHSDEYVYLNDENATGFVKEYADGKYAFVALLPKEGMSVDEYVQALTAEKLSALLSNQEAETVKATMPKFECEYVTEMDKLLQEMGMTDAFNEEIADFTGLGKSMDGNNLYINRVLHKTFISVDERGTKAGAASVVEMVEAAMIEEIFVTLDRPFVYMIIDTRATMPLFMGVVRSVAK